MKDKSISTATAIYRLAALITARVLAASDMVESVLVHRTVATGEVSFGRSDIDLLVVVGQEDPQDGEKLAALYRKTRMLRCINLAIGHIEVHDPPGFADFAATDTYWGALERLGSMVLWGKSVTIPQRAVDPRHAMGFFGVWGEWFFPIAVQQKKRRNLRKTAIDVWNSYATAEGLIPEPHPKRSESEARLRVLDPNVLMERLEEPQYAATFVYRLAERLHRRFLPPLGSLSEPVIFETVVPPRARRRLFVVLPRPDYPLPPQAFMKRAFLTTPEALDLYLHYTNPFFYWALPPRLLDIGMGAPAVAEFLQACRWYGNSRFLRHPGFLYPDVNIPVAIVTSIRHALGWLSRGEVPPPLSQAELQQIATAPMSCADYYRTAYARVCREGQQIRQSAAALSRTAEILPSGGFA